MPSTRGGLLEWSIDKQSTPTERSDWSVLHAYVISERAKERAQSYSCSIEISGTNVYKYICMWPYVKLYAHARWYVMLEGLSVNHFLKHSSHFK